ncbi:phage terminase small subunit [Pseudoclavibacter sp. 13-3]|uniref:phage terminase small subunit n=1 Tax=Pseudoclavibacter sp. 13-3 TaxID=2901228 RepID=UPI001E5057DC|nr:hypothetical protein [Pseudoclavibacter sp. 13-3]MCD7100460.1 hypothetical protein [Pseudoclavibacter sp. 13-3]
MGTRGPVPKRTEDRQRRNEPEIAVRKAKGARGVRPPIANKAWHPLAKRLWTAMKVSGQAKFYEPSDWAFAYSLMDDLTYYKTASKRSGQMLTAIYQAMSALLLTEADRRRVAIELERPEEATAEDSEKVARMSEWRNRFS